MQRGGRADRVARVVQDFRAAEKTMNLQNVLDELVEQRNDLLTDRYWQTVPIPLRLKLLKLFAAVIALAEHGRDREQQNHEMLMQHGHANSARGD